ncbi:MAG TPA: hypothetical protein VMW74_02135 [Nitrosopumilaceae archaeon]|nr:hypothetical protein [Nitrosopumilaceae archaeon]
MKKSVILLIIVGSLIGVGIILSFYGNYLLFEGLIQNNGDVGLGQSLIIEVELDHTETQKGIYAVQIIDVEGESVSASILDPFNQEIESHLIEQKLHEGFFDVATSGNYKLIIENSGDQVKIFGVIGPEPDAWKKSLDSISLIILAMGLIGMVGIAGYTVIKRKKS